MKKFIAILVVVLSLVSNDAMAQKKGDFYVGGDFGIGVNHASMTIKDYGNTGSATAVEFSIMPKVGFFVIDNLLLGFNLGYGVESNDVASHTLFLGPTVSYYLPLCKNLYYTPALDLGFCYAASEGEGVPGFGFGLTLFGLEYRPAEKWGISGSLLSLDYTLLSKDGVTLHNVDFGLTINPTIGVKYYF